MIVDLPDGHPIQALSDSIWQALVDRTPLGLSAGGPAPRIAIGGDGLMWPLSPASDGGRSVAVVDRDARTIRLSAWADLGPLSALAERAATGRPLSAPNQVWARVLVHEQLHLLSPMRAAGQLPIPDRLVEEAAVDAVAADLTPLVVPTSTGAPAMEPDVDVGAGYYRCVRLIRAASRHATQTATWRHPAAALWRIRLVMAGQLDRGRMLIAAGVDPLAVAC